MPNRACEPFPDARDWPPLMERYQCACCGAEAWTNDGPPLGWKRAPAGHRFAPEPASLICANCQQRWPRAH